MSVSTGYYNLASGRRIGASLIFACGKHPRQNGGNRNAAQQENQRMREPHGRLMCALLPHATRANTLSSFLQRLQRFKLGKLVDILRAIRCSLRID